MNKDDRGHCFVEQAKTRLDQTESQLDTETLGKLRDARCEALATKTKISWKMPTTAFASLVFCALLVNSLMIPDEPSVPVELFEDVALLSSQDELEMYEDMDLILWLLEEEASHDLG